MQFSDMPSQQGFFGLRDYTRAIVAIVQLARSRPDRTLYSEDMDVIARVLRVSVDTVIEAFSMLSHPGIAVLQFSSVSATTGRSIPLSTTLQKIIKAGSDNETAMAEAAEEFVKGRMKYVLVQTPEEIAKSN